MGSKSQSKDNYLDLGTSSRLLIEIELLGYEDSLFRFFKWNNNTERSISLVIIDATTSALYLTSFTVFPVK